MWNSPWRPKMGIIQRDMASYEFSLSTPWLNLFPHYLLHAVPLTSSSFLRHTKRFHSSLRFFHLYPKSASTNITVPSYLTSFFNEMNTAGKTATTTTFSLPFKSVFYYTALGTIWHNICIYFFSFCIACHLDKKFPKGGNFFHCSLLYPSSWNNA